MPAALVALAIPGCSGSNNLLLGRVSADVAGHPVVVTDCYRLHAPAPEAPRPGTRATRSVRYAPCRDAIVEIRGDSLTVNGRAYGRLAPGQPVLVDHGAVSVGGSD